MKLPALALLIGMATAVASPASFERIRTGQKVRIVMAIGTCQARVAGRTPGELTLKLKETTTVCGARDSLVRLSRDQVDRVERPRLDVPFGPGTNAGRVVAGGGSALLLALGERSDSPVPFLAVLGGLAVYAVAHGRANAEYDVYVATAAPQPEPPPMKLRRRE